MKAAGIPFEDKEIDGNLKSPEILALNPKGTMPFIMIGDKVYTESASILRYLAAKYPQANKYYPEDLTTRFEVEKALDYVGNTLRPAFMNIIFKFF